MDLFESKPPRNAEHVEAIRAWISARLQLTTDAVILVSELRCTEPGCPPLETMIAIMTGKRRQFKIHKSLAAISAVDIEALEINEE
jgi:hypothetical protein